MAILFESRLLFHLLSSYEHVWVTGDSARTQGCALMSHRHRELTKLLYWREVEGKDVNCVTLGKFSISGPLKLLTGRYFFLSPCYHGSALPQTSLLFSMLFSQSKIFCKLHWYFWFVDLLIDWYILSPLLYDVYCYQTTSVL